MIGKQTVTSSGSLIAATLAVVASSCCALPLALILAGVSSGIVGALSETLYTIRPYVMVGSVALVGVAWVIAWRRRANRTTFAILAVATLLLLIALSWREWDPALTKWLFSRA
jgi:mercuric ion transport protein